MGRLTIVHTHTHTETDFDCKSVTVFTFDATDAKYSTHLVW